MSRSAIATPSATRSGSKFRKLPSIMPRKTTDALGGQAQTLAAAAEAAARWFRKPDPAAIASLKTARLRVRGWREEALSVLKGTRGPAKNDAADFSFAVREAVEGAAQAVLDAERWGLGSDDAFAALAASLRDGARALARAADSDGRERALALVEAKRWAADAERRRLAERRVAHDGPFSVGGAQRGEIAERLSSAAEALQQACDALAGDFAS